MFTNDLPSLNIDWSFKEVRAASKSLAALIYVSSTRAEPWPVNIAIIPFKSKGAISCPLFLEKIVLPFFTLAKRFWPSVFSVGACSKSNLPCKALVTILLKSAKVKELSSNAL